MTHESSFAAREWGTLPHITHQDTSNGQVPRRRASSAGEVPAVFQALDPNKRNVLDFRAALDGLSQLGVANGQDTLRTVSGLLGMSSPSHVRNHQFTLPEFVACYEMLSRAQYKPSRLDQAVLYSRASQISAGADNEMVLKLVYNNYCRFTVGQGKLIYDEADPKMSSTQFVKLCCDLGVLQPAGPLNVVVIDLIFHKCKPHGKNRFQYPDFLKALDSIEADSELRVMDLIYILGAQIKPSPQFFAPKPITSLPKEHYNSRKGLRPTTAWGRSSSGAGGPAMSSPVQDLRRAIEEAESRKSPTNLESSVKNKGAALSNKAQDIEELVVSLHEQLQDLKDQNADLGTELQYLKELVPEADRAKAQEIQGLRAALLVALKSVGVESVEAAEEPSMLKVASAYHEKMLRNDSKLLELADRVASLEASEQEHSQKLEASHHAAAEQMSGLGQQLSKLEEQDSQQREVANQAAEKIWGLGQQMSKLEVQGSQQREMANQAAEKIWDLGQQLSKLEEQGSQQREAANQVAEKMLGLGQQLSKLEEQGRQQREATSQATEQMSGLMQQLCKLEEQSSQQQQEVAQHREAANQAAEQISGLSLQLSKLEEQGGQQQQEVAQQQETASHVAEQISGVGRQLSKLEEQGSQQQQEVAQKLAAVQQDLAMQLATAQEQAQAAQQDSMAKLAELEKWRQEGSARLAELERWQQEVSAKQQAVQQDSLAELEKWQQEGSAKLAELERCQQEISAKQQAVQQDSLAELEKWQQEGSAKLAELERCQQEISAKQQAVQQDSLAKLEKWQQEGSAKLVELERCQQEISAKQQAAQQDSQAELEKWQQEGSARLTELEKWQQEGSAKLTELEQWRAEQQEAARQLAAVQEELAKQEDASAKLAKLETVHAQQQEEGGQVVQEATKQLAELQAQMAAVQQWQTEQHESNKAVQEMTKQLAELQAQLAAVQQVQAEQQKEESKAGAETSTQLSELHRQLAEQQAHQEDGQAAQQHANQLLQSLQEQLESRASQERGMQEQQQQQQQQLADVLAQLQAVQAQLEDKREGTQHTQQESVQQLQDCGKQLAELERRLAEQEGQLKSAVLDPRDVRASLRPGLEAVAAMLEVLGRGPCDGQRRLGMATAAAALQAMAEVPESASSHREFSVAVGAMKQMGMDPSDQAYREGLEAAAAALAAVVKNADTGVHGTDFGAAAAALQSICQVPWDADCRPGVMAGVVGLQAMAEDPKQASHEPGIRAAIAVLHALGCDPGDPDQRQGLAAASTALETMASLPVLPGHAPGLEAASVSLNALRHVAQEAHISQNESAAAESEPAGRQGALRRRVSGAVTATAALEKLGMVPHDELHHPGMLAAAAALRAYAEGPRSSALELSPAEEAKKAYSALRTEAASTALPAMKQQLESLEQQLQQMPAVQEQVQALEKQLQQAQQALGLGLSALGLDEAGLGVPDAAAMPAKQKHFEELAAAVRTLEAKEGKEAALKDSLSQAISALAPKLAEVEQEAKVLKDTCVHKSELKELENFLLDRINTQDSGHEQMRLTLDAIVADITKLAMEHGLSKGLEERKPKDKSLPSSLLQPFTLSTVLRNFMSYSELVERFATLKGLQELANTEKTNSEMARKNEEAILLALKSVDQKFTSQSDSMAKVLIRTARQVDYLHNAIREIPGAEETELPGADPSHPAQMEELHAELDHQPPSAGGAPHPLQAMGAIGRSSGMRALLMQQNEAGENPVDQAMRSINENAAENFAEEAAEEEGNGPDANRSSAPEPRKHISSASAGWAMALKSMKTRQSPAENPQRESAGWNLLQLAAQDVSKDPEPEAPKAEEKQAKVSDGRNKVSTPARPSRIQEASPGPQHAPVSSPGRSRGPSQGVAPPASPAEPPSGSVFARRGADPPGASMAPAARGNWSRDGDKRGSGGRHRTPQSYLPPGAVAPPS